MGFTLGVIGLLQRVCVRTQLAVQVAAVHTRSRGTYGSPRIHADLRAKGVPDGSIRKEVQGRTTYESLASVAISVAGNPALTWM